MKRIYSFILVWVVSVFSLLLWCNTCLAREAIEEENSGWRSIESKYCTIFYHPGVNLKRVNNRISIRFYDIVFDNQRFFSAKGKSIEEQIAEKFDRILYKDEKVLDMYPSQIHIKVKIFQNQSQLDEEYRRIFGQPNTGGIVSFYVHKYETVYTTERVIRQGLLAHEIGHAVVDHYFLIRPPEIIRELLAQHAEFHLED